MKATDKEAELHESVETQDINGSPNPNLRTDMSHSTAQATQNMKNNTSINETNINGGPSVGLEDSKFLMESSLAQGQSISNQQDSRFTGNLGEHSVDQFKNMTPGRDPNMITPDMLSNQQRLDDASNAMMGVVEEEYVMTKKAHY